MKRTLASRTDGAGGRVGDVDLPFGPPPATNGVFQRALHSPLWLIALYYIVLVAVAVVLIREFPLVRRALIVPAMPVLGEGAAILTGTVADSPTAPSVLTTPAFERALTTFFVATAALGLAIPVAWIYMLTKRLRFDSGLVRSVIILPIAVAGILLIVKNSLAVAFSLAGIVAAVRFRNTLKDPRDAVYIFMTIGIGIAAGVQAVDVALVVSLVFNGAVFVLWRFQIGSPHGGSYGRTGVLSIGDPRLLVGQTPAAYESVRQRIVAEGDDLTVDGMLLVHTTEPEVTRHAVLDALRQNADDWRTLESVERGRELATAQYLVQLNKKAEPADLLGALDEWSARIRAAEFIPFHRRRRPRESEPDDEDDDD